MLYPALGREWQALRLGRHATRLGVSLSLLQPRARTRTLVVEQRLEHGTVSEEKLVLSRGKLASARQGMHLVFLVVKSHSPIP